MSKEIKVIEEDLPQVIKEGSFQVLNFSSVAVKLCRSLLKGLGLC